MTEPSKTLAFVAAGALAVSAAYFVDRGVGGDVDAAKQQLVGKTLNGNIDVSAPKRLRVVKFDRATASVREFDVAEVDGVWSLPSKEDYPADATEQMAAAATSVVNRKVLRVADDEADSHAKYGVVDPLSPKLDAKSTGVGTRVIMTDAGDETLVDMIIGKRVAGSPGQRYVRNNLQDVVYVVEIDPTQLSTNFADWIKDDLLELDTFALRRLFVNDYTADLSIGMSGDGRLVPQIGLDQRHEITLAHPKDGSTWDIASLKKEDPQAQDMVDDPVAADEEVNQDAVQGLVTGLDDLLIVDVAKKPEGLSADLKAGEDFLTNQEAFQELASKGFIPYRGEILSSEGEVICTLDNGVEYVLRFGQFKVQTDGAEGAADEDDAEASEGDDPAETDAGEESKADDASGADADDAAETGDAAAETPADAAEEGAAKPDADGENLRRYLFVMARFSEGAVERPALQELPPLPEESAETADAAAEAPAEESPTAEGEATADAAAGASEEAADAGGEGDAAESKEKDAEAIMAERKQIEEENQRLMDEYQSTLAEGQKKVAELNERFGDWYYVISNDVYKKIHLGRDQVIKKKEQPVEGAAATGDAATDATSGLPSLPVEIPGVEAAGADAAAGDTATPATDQP